MNSKISNKAGAISIKDLRFRYPKAKADAIDIKHWQVAQGDHVFVHGPSGCGKSTLLNLITGILASKHNAIEVLGHGLSELSARQRDAFRAANIGVVFQQFNLVPYLTVLENIQLAAHFAGTSDIDIQQRYRELFTGLKLSLSLIEQRADKLSVGQQQRVAIARALINQPPLLIVDEPTSALDNDAKNAFMTLLMDLVNRHTMTLIFVSHDESLSTYFSSKFNMLDINSNVNYYDC
jgi:putative ABC transport system ATP-binding protein